MGGATLGVLLASALFTVNISASKRHALFSRGAPYSPRLPVRLASGVDISIGDSLGAHSLQPSIVLIGPSEVMVVIPIVVPNEGAEHDSVPFQPYVDPQVCTRAGQSPRRVRSRANTQSQETPYLAAGSANYYLSACLQVCVVPH